MEKLGLVWKIISSVLIIQQLSLRNNGNRIKNLFLFISLNCPFSVFNSSLSSHSCDICCPHLFLVLPKHFMLSVLAKHHDSDQFGCSLKSQLTPDGELCETGKNPPKPKNLRTLKVLLAVLSKMFFRQQVFLFLFFKKYLWNCISFRTSGTVLLMTNVVILLIFMGFNSCSNYSLCTVLYNTFL